MNSSRNYCNPIPAVDIPACFAVFKREASMASLLFFCVLFFFQSASFAASIFDDLPRDFFRSAGVGVTSVSSATDLQSKTGRRILTFNPRVSGGYKFSLETKYIELGYTFTPSNTSGDNQTNNYHDLRINFFWKNFDGRLNYQHYNGAEVRDSGETAYYSDYKVRAYNARVHYYFNEKYLRVIREGQDLVHKASGHAGLSTTGSWFVGVNLDRRMIHLPDVLSAAHQNHVNKYGINYDTTFSAFTGGPLAGGDGMVQLGTFFLRGKLGLGPAFLPGGNSTAQFEFGMSTGFAFFKNHLISLIVDTYQISFKDDDQRISNLNTQINLMYTYAF
jgi:hypothetical protein